jgi:hypothetical protein
MAASAQFRQDLRSDVNDASLPSKDVRAIAVAGATVWAGTSAGIASRSVEGGQWTLRSPAVAARIAPDGKAGAWAATDRGFLHLAPNGDATPLAGLEKAAGVWIAPAKEGGAWCLEAQRLLRWDGAIKAAFPAPEGMELDWVAEDAAGRVFLGARLIAGGYSSGERGVAVSYIRQLLKLDGGRLQPHNSIANSRGRSVDDELLAGAIDGSGLIWIGTPDGLNLTDGDSWWSALDGRDGLPSNDTRCIAPGVDGTLWTGTPAGACRLKEGRWSLFRGKRWLPGDDIRAIAPDGRGGAWLATGDGVGRIVSTPITLQQKAAHFEEITLARHNRNGYITISRMTDGDYAVEASDNDGLWSAVYCAAECFRYAVTKEPTARDLARRSMQAIMDLERLTGVSGLPARAVLRDGETHVWQSQGHWHRSSVNPSYQWKGDTSSDELDGHFFICPIYYDLVADDAEKAELRAYVRRLTDHLLSHNYRLFDVTGQPTRWGIFNPESLNDDLSWEENRALNSLSILAYLKVAFHMTGDQRYQTAYEELIHRHHYLLNTLYTKQLPPFSVNHSDDQLEFLDYYSILQYERNPEYRRILLLTLERSWQIARPERAALFNVIYGAVTGHPCDVQQTLQTLTEWPWDLRHWTVKNSDRSDVRLNPDATDGLLSQTVLPYGERRTMQWSDNPYALDGGDDGKTEYDGTAWLLPYWMARHWRIIESDSTLARGNRG